MSNRLEELQAELAQVLGELRERHGVLARISDPGGEGERSLLEALSRRDALIVEIGRVVARLVAAGTTVSVTPPPAPAPTPAPAPAPAPTPAPPAPRPEPPRPEPPRPEPPRPRPPPPPQRAAHAPRSLRQTLALIDEPVEVRDAAAAIAMVERVVEACDDPDEWLQHPTEIQRSLVGLTSSLARHVQDEVDVVLPAPVAGALGAWFSTMTRWSKLYRPGFVAGLSRSNRPERDRWIEDARMWWEQLSVHVPLGASLLASALGGGATTTPGVAPTAGEDGPSAHEALLALEQVLDDPDADLTEPLAVVLEAGVGQRDNRLVALLAPHRDRVAKVRGLKTLKSALKFARQDPVTEEVPADTVETSPIPDDWPFLKLTEGMAAVIVGGDPRSEHADRIKDAFRFASVAWNEIDPRRVDALASRIRAGTHGMVVLLREFVSHSVADAVLGACKDADVPYVVVDTGYGVNQVRLAAERYLRGRLE
ncbi:MAG: hypothetical protein H6735_31245 [Alphaproteobacteria bacterium]|nr:hypothetical protein [Alphaproteobacteria bacterium]